MMHFEEVTVKVAANVAGLTTRVYVPVLPLNSEDGRPKVDAPLKVTVVPYVPDALLSVYAYLVKVSSVGDIPSTQVCR